MLYDAWDTARRGGGRCLRFPSFSKLKRESMSLHSSCINEWKIDSLLQTARAHGSQMKESLSCRNDTLALVGSEAGDHLVFGAALVEVLRAAYLHYRFFRSIISASPFSPAASALSSVGIWNKYWDVRLTMMSRVCTAYDARSIITGPAGSENLISSAGICELLCTHVINRKRLLTQTRLFHTHS